MQEIAIYPKLSTHEKTIKLKKSLSQEIIFLAGDGEHFEKPTVPIDTIVSNMVFHHLTDSGKEQAIKQYNRRGNYLRRHAVFI